MNSLHPEEGMHYEGDCIRPPPEADSILLQVTLGCSHNKCTFCGTFKKKRFRIKDAEVIAGDIRYAAKYMQRQKRLFLMDGDALIIPQKRLMGILSQIKADLPWVERVGAYANTKSISLKSPQDLRELREAGLGMLYLGVESGDDRVRKKIRKGSSAQHCLDMGLRVKAAGIQLTLTLLLGIAGKEGSLAHARATGQLVSAIDPEFASALTVILIPGTQLWEDYAAGDFEMPDERGLLLEMRELIVHTHLQNGVFSSSHASNYLPIRARFPEEKQAVLDLIDAALKGEVGLKPEWMRAF